MEDSVDVTTNKENLLDFPIESHNEGHQSDNEVGINVIQKFQSCEANVNNTIEKLGSLKDCFIISNINNCDEVYSSVEIKDMGKPKECIAEQRKDSLDKAIYESSFIDESQILNIQEDSLIKAEQFDPKDYTSKSINTHKHISEIFLDTPVNFNGVVLDRSFLTESCTTNDTEEEKQGLWFKDDLLLSSDLVCMNNHCNKEEYDKILSYEHEFAVPTVIEPLNLSLDKKIAYSDFNFDETDFKDRRSSSINQLKFKKKKRKHANIKKIKRIKHNSRNEQRTDEVFIKDNAKTFVEKKMDDDKSIDLEQKGGYDHEKISKLSKVNELRSNSDVTNIGSNKRKHSKKTVHNKKHNHVRHHRHKIVGSQENSLESRILSGIKTLKDEHRAIQELTSEIKKDFRKEEIDEIYSHRYGYFAGLSRQLYGKHVSKSGMTTHINIEKFDNSKKVFEKPDVHIRMIDDLNLSPREGFVELEELTATDNNELQWKERARWLKFEEDIEKNERWGKPHVASLSFRSLLELRRGVERGTVLLNLESYDLPSIFESVVDNMIITDQVHHSMRDKLISILLSKHCHQHQRTAGLRPKNSASTSSMANELVIKNSLNNDKLEESDIVEADHVGFVDSSNQKEKLKKIYSDDGCGHRSRKPNDYNRQLSLPTFGNNVLKKTNSSGGGEDGGFLKLSSMKFRPIIDISDESNKESDIKTKIPDGAEASSVLVATIDDLDRPAMAFVRLSKGCMLGNLSEVNIPIRFLFLILGPSSSLDYYEIGRSIATLMSDKIFHDLIYTAKNRDDILDAMNSFLDDSVVLAPGDWDRHLLLPLLQAEITEKKQQRIKLMKEKGTYKHCDDDLFLRTSKWFGGLKRDFFKKAQFYRSDFSDGLNIRCLVTIIFVFFATLAPTITFGALLGKKTEDNLGVMETLIATGLCGIIFSLFAGQPLIIIGATGPILVFEQATYMLCQYFHLDFLIWRLYIGLMVMVILWVVVALEGCFLVEYFTRFTEEVFSVLISLLFLYEAFSFIFDTFKENKIDVAKNVSFYNETFCSIKTGDNELNIGLISFLLVIGTLFIAQKLRQLRNSHFFSSNSRRVLSDFGVPIAMILMVVLNSFIKDVEIPKIKMSSSIKPTSKNRTVFFVNPVGSDIKVGWIAFAVVPAICVSILLFMETELTGVLLNKRKNKLRKSGGYNLDIFIMGGLTGLCSILGLPWMCAGSVMSIQHQNALAILSRTHAPGEKPYLLQIKEQRLTNLCIHVIIGCCIFAEYLISKIPLAVCFGVFMYLGIASLSGIQFVEQIKLIFVPMKYHPNKKYLRMVRFRSMVTYTFIQVFCLCVLFGIKLSPVAPLFPFAIMIMVFLRRFLTRVYKDEELKELDNEDDHEEFEDLDEYGTSLSI
ncbi:band 3 anion transport protein isoform X3 [Hydra vulgaris]|uniref:Anion exchange protein n=1 Tax=Hydra vulgaris TaxID=6087 RepID=A0ABM4C4L7_HYDVU